MALMLTTGHTEPLNLKSFEKPEALKFKSFNPPDQLPANLAILLISPKAVFVHWLYSIASSAR